MYCRPSAQHRLDRIQPELVLVFVLVPVSIQRVDQSHRTFVHLEWLQDLFMIASGRDVLSNLPTQIWTVL